MTNVPKAPIAIKTPARTTAFSSLSVPFVLPKS